MKTCDVANMMSCWDKSLGILIKHLKKGEPEITLEKAEDMQRILHKEMGYLQDEKTVILKGMPPQGAII